MHESVYGVFLVLDVSSYAICVCLKHRATALAVVAASAVRLRTSRRRTLIRLLRLHDDLLQTIALLVGAAVLHLRHRLLYVSEPSVRHFVLSAGNESGLTGTRTEVPLAAIRMRIIQHFKPSKCFIWHN